MSTNINQYIGYGILMTPKEWKELTKAFPEEWYRNLSESYNSSAFDNKWVEINGFTFIDDPMCEEFYFYGKIYAKSTEDKSLGLLGVEVPNQELRYNLFHAYQALFKQKPNKDPQFVIMTTYS